MPLRAIKNKQIIQSYNISKEEWQKLKDTKKEFQLTMPCCNNEAILKTSKLGTQFFAHGRRGTCTSKTETKEHLLAKSIIAKVCQDSGWETITEYKGKSPSDKIWIADVYAERNNIKIVFEVQWSSQTEEITRKRQNRYKESGIRSAWLVKETKNNKCISNNVESKELPYFLIKYNEKKNDFTIPSFNISLKQLITGMLNKQLTWFPQKGMSVEAGLIIGIDNCWKCKKSISIALGLLVNNKNKNFEEFYNFKKVSTTIKTMITPSLQKQYHLGQIKDRFSKTMQNKYLSNGCYYCDAIYGNFFLSEHTLDFIHEDIYPTPIKIENYQLGKEIPMPYQTWYFQEKI